MVSVELAIGFWINKKARPAEQRPSPASGPLQAFVVNRIGDVGFIIGIMILFVSTGTFEFSKLQTAVLGMDKTVLTIAMICIFCGAIGKSAQFPLHVWLPSAMENHDPRECADPRSEQWLLLASTWSHVHSLYSLRHTDPLAFQVVGWIGAFTAFFAATIALVQSDFKRVLAFSTISQLGYMFVGLAVAGPEYGTGPGMFHLFTHAFFKALLFLGGC